MTHSMGSMGNQGYDPEINCPRCHVRMLKQPDRNAPGVMIDICPNCRGTWFDDGELPIVFNAVASQGKFRTRPQSFFTAQPQQHYGVAHGHANRRHHRGSSDSLFDGFFGGSS